jgi:hypothetical protein
MNRRGLLKGMGAAAAATLWPGWLSEAFAGPACSPLKGAVTLSAAIQRAHAALQPLLVFVIPKDNGLKWERGRHFGEWLNHGTHLDLAPLACATVVCAEMDAVRQLFPSAPKDEEPAILVMDVDRSPARIAVALPAFNHVDMDFDRFAERPELEGKTEEERRQAYFKWREEQINREDQAITACIQCTGKAVRDAIFGDAAVMKRRADATWDRLSASERAAAQRLISGGEGGGTREEVLAAAPVIAMAALEGSGDSRLVQALSEAARGRYSTQRIPGSKWANASGCGEEIEGEDDNLVVGCGMGHVPARSQRFLYFFTRSPYAPPPAEE